MSRILSAGTPMRAGRLRHRIQLQSATSTQDAFGEPTFTWTTYATVWASIVPTSAIDTLEDGQRKVERYYRVRIRHRANIHPRHRIKLADSRILEITAVLNVGERDREIVMDCTEKLV